MVLLEFVVLRNTLIKQNNTLCVQSPITYVSRNALRVLRICQMVDWKIRDKLPVMTTELSKKHTFALYCDASGDHNPIHVNFDYAKEAGLEEVFLH